MLVLNPDLINSCRVCRSPNQDGDYQCLFEIVSEHEERSTELSESGVLYEQLLDISLNERDYFPKFLCNSCHLQMKLKEKALKTLEYLQSIYEEVEPLKKEILDYNYQSNEQIITPNEPLDCQDLLDEYQLKGYDVYQETEEREYVENIVEQLDTTAADKSAYENANYSYQTVNVENELNKLAYNELHIEQGRLNTEQQRTNSEAANIETNFEGDIKEQFDSLENKVLTEIEPNEKIIQIPNSEEHFPDMKMENTLDKNDYVTEIYELIDDQCDIDEKYLENQEIADVDYNSISETNTETSSPYNNIEYLLEEEKVVIEDEPNLLETENASKRRRLNKEYKRSRTYECSSCQLEFKNLHMYKSHRIESHGENFTCNACSKEYKTIAALQKHIKSQHNGEPAFQCEICLKTFSQKVHFQYHINHHNNVRNYKCDICEKAFIAKSDLKTHLRLHTGERPYVCNVCGKDYLMMEHLKAHFITHTEQSFPCEVCNKQFTTHKTLRLHVRTIHEDEPRFKCTFCLKPFRRKHHLEYHLKLHEKNVKKSDVSGVIANESVHLEDLAEEAIDDPGFTFLA